MSDQIVGTGHGLTTAEWSTSGASHAVGIITQYESLSTSEKEPIPNQAGGDQGILFYNKGRRVRISAIIKNGQTAPAVGALVTVALPATAGGEAASFIVDSDPKVTGRLKAWQEVTFEVFKPEALAVS